MLEGFMAFVQESHVWHVYTVSDPYVGTCKCHAVGLNAKCCKALKFND